MSCLLGEGIGRVDGVFVGSGSGVFGWSKLVPAALESIAYGCGE